MAEKWDEDIWYNNFLFFRNVFYESGKEAYDKCTEHNQQLYDDMMYHYFQMVDCAEHLKVWHCGRITGVIYG